MGLIKFSNYTGSKISTESMFNITYCGLAEYAMSYGYHINVEPIHSKTPKGMIDDSPDAHEIVLTRNKYIDENSKEATLGDEKIIEIESKDNFKIAYLFGYNVDNTNEIITAEDGTRFFRNTIKIKVKRFKNEEDADYSLRITDVAMRAFKLNGD